MSTHHGILLHVVFSTKYRKPHLAEAWRDDLFACIGGTVKDHKSTLLKAGGIEDHIHLLLRIHPEFAISKTVQLLKANSSKWINDQRKTGRKFQWQTGYGAFSVSQSMSETVKNYIGSQREHHRKRTFETEYLSLLEKHGIEYDPTFVFETEIIGRPTVGVVRDQVAQRRRIAPRSVP
jgi:putative transposase